MNSLSIVIVCIVLFLIAGVVAYVIETVLLRRKGKLKGDESLIDFYREIDQKQGNKVVISWTVIWLILMVLCAVIIYLVY
ncbi:MAG: hypothetical protein IKS85_02300 [Lachnospiraceae bacterium]|nr:hypothetical protein [Lachnospiraceae bacterium]